MGILPNYQLAAQPPSRWDGRLRFGLLLGGTLGLALAAGLWLPALTRMTGVPLSLFYGVMGLGFGGLLLIGLVAGWLAGLVDRAWVGLIVWIGAALAMTWVVGHLFFEGQTWMTWLADRRFWGQEIYPSTEATRLRMGLAGFFIVLLLAFYGLFQSIRVEALRNRLDERRRLTAQAWIGLLAALIPALVVGAIVNDILFQPLFNAPRVVDQAIRTARVTEKDDLFQLSLESAINYNALRAVHDRLDGPYTLQYGDIRLGYGNDFAIVVRFDSGAWVNCVLIADQLNNCRDASPPYTQGFPTLIATGDLPADCRACNIRVSPEQAADLAQRRARLGAEPVVRTLAQRGGHVLMRAESASGDYAFDCFVTGISPVILGECRDVP